MSHHFGPAGSFVTTEANGWFIVGFTLDRKLVVGSVARATLATSKETAAAVRLQTPAAVHVGPVKAAPVKPLPILEVLPAATAPATAEMGAKPVKTATK